MTKDGNGLDPDFLALARALGRYQANLDLRQPSEDATDEADPDQADHDARPRSRRPLNDGVIEMGCMVIKISQNHHRSFSGASIL